jgi:Lysyl oxidase
MLRSKWARALVVAVAIGAALSVPASSMASRPSPASLRMVSVLRHVDATRFGGDTFIFISPGVYLAATGGAFEIDAIRDADGTIALWQVERGPHGVQPIRQIAPANRVRMSAGLPQFLQVSMTNAAGDVVLAKSLAMCLGEGYGFSRVDASGPDHTRFPYGCGGPFTRAAVWGIDEGWASAINLSFRFAPPDGTYTLRLAINDLYARQLGIAPEEASASLRVTVTTQTGGECGVLHCPFAATASASSAPVAPGTDGLRQGDGAPDLRALPAHHLSVVHNRRSGRDYLNFAATIWNAGSGPLVVEGYRTTPAEVMPATQFIYADGVPQRSQVVGEFEFDNRSGHHHWHMADIARYDLLDQSGNRLVLSNKQSFCLAPTDEIDLTLPGAEWQPDQVGLWSACDGEAAIWLREVLPAGWGDTYFQTVAGQSFNITNLANGHYQVRVTVDPANHLIETSYDNNVGLLSITLGGTPGHRSVKIG